MNKMSLINKEPEICTDADTDSFHEEDVFKKLMIRFLLGKSITFRVTWTLINEFTVPV